MNSDLATRLINAIEQNKSDEVKNCLEAGADPNGIGLFDIPLYLAADYSREKIVTILLEAGADVNKQDWNQKTPLYAAVYRGNQNIIDILLKAGADPNLANSHGQTPLEWPVRMRKKEIVKKLLLSGADISQANNQGKTPLDLAEGTMRNLLLTDVKVKKMWALWELESAQCNSYLQWLPKEMAEDVQGIMMDTPNEETSVVISK